MSNSKSYSAPKRRHKRRLPVWAGVIIVMLLFLLLLLAAALITINMTLNKISRPDLTAENEFYTEEELAELDLAEAVAAGNAAGLGSDEVETVYPELSPDSITWTSPSEEVAAAETVYNILLIGQDARDGETRARSDSMILVTINKTTKTITMTSFLRDLYVQIPGYNDNRINAAYAFGGMSLLDQTIYENFGVEIDANIEVRFEAFEEIIDILGGVDIDLTSAEANYLGLSAGVNHLNGENALSYARIRYIDSDVYRSARQRNVMSVVYSNFKNASTSQIMALINEILPLLTTDLTNTEILALAIDLVPILSGSTLNSQCVPADGTYTFNTINSMAVIVADMDANRQFLKDTLE